MCETRVSHDRRLLAYDAYGHRSARATGAHVGYAGVARDTWVLWYALGERIYIPSLRRFMSPDIASPFDTGGLNRYGFCAGDPVNRIDPSGRSWIEWLGLVVGMAGALIGTVMTGGMLAGAFAATGSVTAAVMDAGISSLVAVALDVTATVAEIGSLASAMAGDEQAASVFGWVALGTGLAATGSALLKLKAVAAAERGVGFANPLDAARHSGRATPVQRSRDYVRTVYSFGGSRTITHYEGLGIAGRRGRLTADGTDVRPAWTAIPNRSGGFNYVADAAVSFQDFPAVMSMVGERKDSLDMIVLVGAHGSPDGINYTNGIRKAEGAVAGFYYHAMTKVPDWSRATGKGPSQISLVNVANLTADEFIETARRRAHVVHAPCYSLADRHFMEAFHIRSVTLYSP